MKAVILYRPKSEHEGKAMDFMRDYRQLKRIEIELISLNTTEGDNLAKLYDITSYPAVLVLTEDGQLQQLWQGGEFPLMNELDSYMQN